MQVNSWGQYYYELTTNLQAQARGTPVGIEGELEYELKYEPEYEANVRLARLEGNAHDENDGLRPIALPDNHLDQQVSKDGRPYKPRNF